MMMTADVEKFHFRLVLLGSLGTGFLFKKFETKYRPTVEDLFSQEFDLGSIVIKVDFLDTSGSMQFPAMRRLSLTTGSAFLMVYALDDENSYEVLKICMQELLEVRPDFQEIPIVFAGNKCDILREKRKVSKEVVSNYVHYELPRLRAKVIECSCRDNINVDNIFRAYLSLAKVTLSTAVSAGLRVIGSGSGSGPLNRVGPKSPLTPTTSSPSPSPSHSNKQENASSTPTSATPSDGPSTPTNKQLSHQQAAFAGGQNSSIKVGLSVRKSCDGSIVSPRRGPFFGVGVAIRQQPSRAHFGSACSTSASTPTSSASATSRLEQTEGSPLGNGGGGRLGEFNLEMAIQSKLSLNERPRSRSLIWRPSRTKSTRSAANNNANNDCRVT